jgi:ankyrin repeat protein
MIACSGPHSDVIVPVLLRARVASTKWLNTEDNAGYTALLLAVTSGKTLAVQSLVQAGADVNKMPKVGQTPLSLAANRRTVDIARILLSAGTMDTGHCETALIDACSRGNLPMVELLLEFKSDINANSEHISPLLAAVSGGHLDVVKVLLAADPPALVNARSTYGTTSLIRASDNMPMFVKVLLAAGADPLQTDNFGKTALMRTRDPACIKLLVEACPEVVNVVDEQGKTVVHSWCCSHKDIMLVKQLFATSESCGVVVDVNKRDYKGNSALDDALNATNHDAVSLLLAHGAIMDDMTIVRALDRDYRSMSSDAKINACLRTMLAHALDTGCFERPAASKSESDDVVEGEDEEEEPSSKRRRQH